MDDEHALGADVNGLAVEIETHALCPILRRDQGHHEAIVRIGSLREAVDLDGCAASGDSARRQARGQFVDPSGIVYSWNFSR
jgi:hypothetical protein